MKKKIDAYILQEIMTPFWVGLGLFFAVITFVQILKVSDAVTGFGITGTELLQALLYSMPPLFGLLLPISCLFATLLGMGRLAVHREIMGLYALGISPYYLLRIPCLLGLIFSLLSCLAMSFGEPWGIRGLRHLMSHSAQHAVVRGVRVGEFNEWIPGITFLAQKKDGALLYNMIFVDRQDASRPIVISAQRAQMRMGEQAEDLVLSMWDGTMFLINDKAHNQHVIHFEQSLYRLDVGRIVGEKGRNLSSIQEKSVTELWQQSHDPTASTNLRAQLLVVLNRKLALPLATLIFALLAVPLSCHAKSAARARGLLISTAIVGTYYYVGRALELASRNATVSPVLATWLPNMLGCIALAWLLWRMPRRA